MQGRAEQSRAGQGSALQLREEFDAVVVRITDDQSVVTIHAHPRRTPEALMNITTFRLLAQLFNQSEGLMRIKDMDRVGRGVTRDMHLQLVKVIHQIG